MGQCQLVKERMKNFKHESKTHLHSTNNSAPPVKAAAAAIPSPSNSPAPVSGTPSTSNQGVNPSQSVDAQGAPEHQVDRPVSDIIKVEQLKKIFVKADEEYLKKVADELNLDLVKYKLNTIFRRAHFFAQVLEEAGPALRANEESLNYVPSALSKFLYYQHHPTEKQTDGRLESVEMIEKIVNGKVKTIKKKVITQQANQEAIGNKAYGNRGSNGAVSSGDGWKYRGRGFIQITFKEDYEKFSNQYNKYWVDSGENFLTNPEKLKEFPYTVRSAVWYWINRKLYEKADAGNNNAAVDSITAVINFHTDTYSERRLNFSLTYAAFK